MLKRLIPGAAALLLPLPILAADEPTRVQPGTPVIITVKPAEAAAPAVTLTLKDRHGHATPHRAGCAHTGGGNVDVQQPSPDTVIVTFTGVAVATGGPKGSSAAFTFDLNQCLDVVFERDDVKAAKITMEGRVIGLLRSGCKGGAAATSGGCASVSGGGVSLVSISVPDHAVAGGENLSINDKTGIASASIGSGSHVLHATWRVTADHPKALLGKAASAEFAPDPALDPLWISAREPFHGVAKKDFGFQVIIRVADATPPPEPKK